MLHIAVDLDDTICDTSSKIIYESIKFHINILKRKYKPIKIDSCDDYFYFAHRLGWNNEDVTLFFKHCYPFYLMNVKPLTEVSSILKSLKKQNCVIHIISARHYNDKVDVVELTKKWLHLNNITYDTLDIGHKQKDQLVRDYNCSVFIDDSFKNCCDVKNSIKNIEVLMFETPFNKKLEMEGLKRVSSWKQIEKLLVEKKE